MDLATVNLDPLLKRLHLANTRRVWRDLLDRAEREAWTYAHLLTLLVTEEIAHRQQTPITLTSGGFAADVKATSAGNG